GKKLLFMGCEFGQWREWNHDASLDWHLREGELHRGVSQRVGDLNRLFREPPLYAHDFDGSGFEWVDAADAEQGVLSYLRRAGERGLLVVCNFAPITRFNYRVGVPCGGYWREVLNSDAPLDGGSGQGNLGGI